MKRFSKLRTFWSDASLKTKLIFSLLMVSMPPLLLSQTILFYFYNQSISEKIIGAQRISVEQTAKMYDISIDAYKKVIYSMLADDSLIGLIEKLDQVSGGERVLTIGNIKNKLIYYSFTKPGITTAAFIPDNSEPIVYEKSAFRVSGTIWDNLDELQGRIYSMAAENTGTYITGIYIDKISTGNERYVFHMANQVRDYSNRRVLGVLVLTVDENYLSGVTVGQSTLTVNSPSSDKTDLSLILSREGQVVSAENKLLIGLNVGTSYSFYTQLGSRENYKVLQEIVNRVIPQNKNLSATKCVMTDYGSSVALTANITSSQWFIVRIINKSNMFSDIEAVKKIYLAVLALTSVAIVAVVIVLSNNLTRSAKQIVAAMELAKEGNLDVRVDLKTKDEMAIVAQTFNVMVKKIALLVENLKQQKDMTALAIEKEKDAQIMALTAQINPHFLYNTLDAINWCLIEQEQYEISKMITSLSSIMRYSISNNEKAVSLQSEYDWLQKYVYLRQCANNNFKFVAHLDPSISHYKIYKLMLQPVIENAIEHGFAGFIQGGILKIEFSDYSKSHFMITVTDNGQGIQESVLSEINAGRYRSESDHGMGLINVMARLNIYYGQSATFQIESSRETGTKTILILPKL